MARFKRAFYSLLVVVAVLAAWVWSMTSPDRVPNGVSGKELMAKQQAVDDKQALDELRAAWPHDSLIQIGEPEGTSPIAQACTAFAITGDLPLYNAPAAQGPGKLKASERKVLDQVCSPPKGEAKSARLRKLDMLAKAGVSGAGAALLREGPPADADKVEWTRRLEALLQAHAVLGDKESIGALAYNYSTAGSTLGQNPSLALRYEYANALIFSRAALAAGEPLPGLAADVLKSAREAGASEDHVRASAAAGNAMEAAAYKRLYQ